MQKWVYVVNLAIRRLSYIHAVILIRPFRPGILEHRYLGRPSLPIYRNLQYCSTVLFIDHGLIVHNIEKLSAFAPYVHLFLLVQVDNTVVKSSLFTRW